MSWTSLLRRIELGKQTHRDTQGWERVRIEDVKVEGAGCKGVKGMIKLDQLIGFLVVSKVVKLGSKEAMKPGSNK